MDETVGKSIAHYKVLERLGGGGMGIVYKALDTRLDRPVALKFLPPHLADSEEARRRFIHEAKASSALDHPNICTIHEIGEHEGRLFIAMAYYEGETLKKKIERGSLPPDEAVRYAEQLASALARAHAAGIVHRDVKPANVMITLEGVAKLLDFGLAKALAQTTHTRSGSTLGTVAYMSPEQVRGDDVDGRADIWALGVVLYEMLTGRRPFPGDYEAAILYAILNSEAHPVTDLRPDVPEALAGIVHRALEKDASWRYGSAKDMLDALGALDARRRFMEAPSFSRLIRRPRVVLAFFAVVLLTAAAILLPAWRRANGDRARAALPEIERLAEEGRYAEAYVLAVRYEQAMGKELRLAALWPVIADSLTIVTDPPDARVRLERFDAAGGRSAPTEAGATPLHGLRVARGDYRVLLDKAGFEPVERVLTRGPLTSSVRLEARLIEAGRVPVDMVFVPGGTYGLVTWALPTTEQAELSDYLIDKYEVSNRDYREFVRAGGYRNRDLWKEPFIREGRTLSWDEAMGYFTDRTGLPGPRGWVSQTFPEAEARHPVTGITWYEAAAYAAWVGKELPTVFQWEKAARNGTSHPFGPVMPWGPLLPTQTSDHRANFSSRGPVAVDEYPFGISPFGAYNMAGNAAEWCRNRMSDGYATIGGSWQAPEYLFAQYAGLPGFHSSPGLGFRCVRTAAATAADQGEMDIPVEGPRRSYTPADERTFRSFLSHYRYDRFPLNPRIVDTMTTPDWTRETVRFDGPGGDEVIAYLYLPTRAAKPYQIINYAPPSPGFIGIRSVAELAEWNLGPIMKGGRAVLAVVPKGGFERPFPPDFEHPAYGTVQHRERVTQMAAEFSRGIDYLETRDDIDMKRLAYVAWSAGGIKIILAAVEPRYRSVTLLGTGLRPDDMDRLPEVNPVHFAPYIGSPALILNGRYDEMEPFETNVRPLFDLMREPKKLVVVDGGHVPPEELRVPALNAWLDETLGPVTFE